MEQAFNPIQEAQIIKQAQNKPKNPDAIINIVAYRSNNQRQQIAQAYFNQFNKQIQDDFRSNFSSSFQEALVALFYTPIDYDCYQIYSAMKGFGTNEDTLIEVIATRSNERINQIKVRYEQLYKKVLVKEIDSETSGFFKRILLALLQAERQVNPNPNEQYCDDCAKRLYASQSEKKEILQEAYIDIFTKKSREELAFISKKYFQWYSKTLLEEVERLFSGDARRVLKAIIYALLSPSEYFAYRIHKAFKKLSTDDTILIRVLVSRDEIDIKRIKRYYEQLYKVSLYDAVKSDISGDYQKLLLALIGI
jgi:hypothetical protein